jgi:Asp-tRNA(Asn)/Glu-tRNA(Gln) amidotransferase A subunit family amidase
MSKAPNSLTATEALHEIENGDLTARALVDACIDRIEAVDSSIEAWAHVGKDNARDHAYQVDQGLRGGPLAGIPFAAKDIIDSHDMPTGYGSPIYDGAQPHADASPIALARAAGGVLLGKTISTEFANVTPGRTRNPLAANRTPGGSSSGSAAAVAAEMAPLAYGTQTTQSTIRPASFCGVHGYCPTQGDFRLSGVREAAGTFDRLGLITRSLADIALLRDVLLLRPPTPFAMTEQAPRIGLCRSHVWDELDLALQSDIEAAAKKLEAAGAEVVDVTLPASFEELADAHRWISSFEFARNFAFEIDKYWDQISPRLRDGRITDGLTGGYDRYRAALAQLEAARAQLSQVFAGVVDVLITASALGEAPEGLEATGSAAVGSLWTPLYLPCVTLPVFKGPAGMPMGLQVLAPLGQDDAMLAAAGWIEAHL